MTAASDTEETSKTIAGVDVELFTECWKSGESMNDLMARFKKSRGSIAGIRSKLKLKPRVTHGANGEKAQGVQIKPVVEGPKQDRSKIRGPLMEDLEPNQCRWPLTIDTPHRFCGEKRKDLQTWYCETHYRAAHAGVRR